MEATFVAIVWSITFCTQPMFVHDDGKCDDGTAPHKLEMRLLEGKSPSSSFDMSKIDDVKVERLFVLLRDDQEVVSLPASLITSDEVQIGRASCRERV